MVAKSGQDTLLSGKWKAKYWYPSNQKPGTEEISEYTGEFKKSGKQYVYESDPQDSGAYMFVRMTVDDDLITGNWHENTSPTGEFRGAIYSGVFQALFEHSMQKIKGIWSGIGQDDGVRKIYSGQWMFERA